MFHLPVSLSDFPATKHFFAYYHQPDIRVVLFRKKVESTEKSRNIFARVECSDKQKIGMASGYLLPGTLLLLFRNRCVKRIGAVVNHIYFCGRNVVLFHNIVFGKLRNGNNAAGFPGKQRRVIVVIFARQPGHHFRVVDKIQVVNDQQVPKWRGQRVVGIR